MLSKNIPSFIMQLKDSTTGNLLIKINSEDVFFAFTSKAVEDVVLNEYSSFIKDGGFKRLKYVLGEGLFTGEEPKHMINKREMSPAFDNDHMKMYEDKVSSIIDKILSDWSGDVDVRHYSKFMIFKSIMEIFFSENIDDDFLKIKNNVAIVSDKIATSLQDDEMAESTKELKEICKKIIDKRLESKENKNDFIDMIINSYNNKIMELDDLYDDALTILLGSYETTAFALEWAIYYLAINKDWQEKISREENLDAFINEVLRLCPPIWNSERMATRDVVIDGTTLPSGTKVVVSSFAMHRDKKVFKDPELFKPERWFEDQDLSKGEYFPFLFGKRQCIGKEFALLEMRTVLTKVAKKFNLELVNKNVSHIGGMSYRPKDPIIINVTNK
jgi:cytochrome P450